MNAQEPDEDLKLLDVICSVELCETCKYMGLGFLDFLRSGEKDIRTLAESRRGRKLGCARFFVPSPSGPRKQTDWLDPGS